MLAAGKLRAGDEHLPAEVHALVHEDVELGRDAWTEEVDRLSDGDVRIVGDEDVGGIARRRRRT